MRERLRALPGRVKRYYRSKSIQLMISISFTAVAVGSMVAMALLLDARFTGAMRQTILLENRQLVNQIALNINSYNASIRDISNTMYYSVIKNADLSDAQGMTREMGLLREANTGALVSIACFAENGELVAAAPAATLKEDVNVAGQDWFIRANAVIENIHFSSPHVQNLFVDTTGRHRWVVSLSRMVELTRGGSTFRGVLLVDMNYAGIEAIFQQMSGEAAGYAYLMDRNGGILYHPRQNLIYSGLYKENNAAAAGYADGIHEENFGGAGRQVIVKTVSYTGWRIVSVIPNSEFAVSFAAMRSPTAAIVGLAIFLVILVNAFVSSRLAGPIKRLDESVRGLEMGDLSGAITVSGPYEIAHLGRTIRKTVAQMRRLMDDIVAEQEQKRKSEFDALQAQINPHFLYNTLDSIVWMIEDGRHIEAISMVTALASLFRISLSRGNTVISIKTELQHAGHYLHIQNIRYKNKFTVAMQVDAAIEDFTTIKLVLQPLLENAIYHAMEVMDGDGVITIRGYRDGGDVCVEVADNGLGIPAEKVATLLTADAPAGSKGSGIGLKNVHQRIRLYYGPAYGLAIESVLDEGTCVRVRLPALREGEGGQKGGGA